METMDLLHHAHGFLWFFPSANNQWANHHELCTTRLEMASCSQLSSFKEHLGCNIGYSIMDTATKKKLPKNGDFLDFKLGFCGFLDS